MVNTLIRQDKLLGPTPSRKSMSDVESLVGQRAAESAVRCHDERNLDVSRKAHDNLESQSAQLHSRLSLRKTRRSTMWPQRRSFGPESDKSGGPVQTRFEVELEEVLEALIMEKLRKTRQVQLEYEQERKEIQALGDSSNAYTGIVETVLQEMDRRMHAELQAVEAHLDCRRREEVNALRKRLGLPS